MILCVLDYNLPHECILPHSSQASQRERVISKTATSNSYGHTSAVPDTTMNVSAQQEQNSSCPSKLKSEMASTNLSRPLSMPSGPGPAQTVAPPMTMLMTDYKAGQTGAENLSLSSYIELMTLVRYYQ